MLNVFPVGQSHCLCLTSLCEVLDFYREGLTHCCDNDLRLTLMALSRCLCDRAPRHTQEHLKPWSISLPAASITDRLRPAAQEDLGQSHRVKEPQVYTNWGFLRAVLLQL